MGPQRGMSSDDWNARYAETELVWGAAPNRFVAAGLGDLRPGRALDLACGEGRNAVWLAERGWQVVGIDFSEVAIERAHRLARDRGVDVEYVVGDVLGVPIEEAAYDLVLLAYLQVPAAERAAILRRSALALRPGGTFFLVGHDLRNHEEGHGGPTDPSLLWTIAEITETLAELGFVIVRAEEALREVDGAARPAIDTLVSARRP